MILGVTTKGPTPSNLADGAKRVQPVTVPKAVTLAKLSAYLDNKGPGSRPQDVRGIVYSTAGALLGYGSTVTIPDGMDAKWVDLAFPTPVALAAGSVHVGIHGGPVSNGVRTYHASSGTSVLQATGDTFADGPASTYGSTTTMAAMSLFATASEDWVRPDAGHAWVAGLAWPESQEVFAKLGPIPGTGQVVPCGWYGTRTDPAREAFALVRRGGPLEDYVGEVLKVTMGSITVYVLARSAKDILEDVAVTRRAFIALAPPALTAPNALVEVVR